MDQPERSQAQAVSTDGVVTDLSADELPLAAELLGRAYRDNPLTFALIGEDSGLRESVTANIFKLRIAAMDPPALAVRDDRGLAGACGFDAPGGSKMSAEDQRKLMEVLSAAGNDVLARAMSMLAEFQQRTPKEPHWHLGPVGVEPDRQGAGIGGAMLRAFCAKMDGEGALAFLETDQEKNARVYEKFGFETIDVAPVIGVPMWFMTRPAE